MEKTPLHIEKVWAWMHGQSMAKRCILSFVVGFIMEMLLFGLAVLMCKSSGVWPAQEIEYYLGLFPIFTCIIINLLNEDLRPSLAASAGTAILVFIMYLSHVVSGVIMAVLLIFQGFCFYQGRKDGIIADILRVLCLIPVFFLATNPYESFSIGFRIFLFASAIICYLITGRKNALKPKGLCMLVIAIILAITPVVNILMYIVYLIFNPDYYP